MSHDHHKKPYSRPMFVWFILLLLSVALRFYRVGLHPIGMDYDQVREAYLASTLFHDFHIIVDNLMFLHLASLRLFQIVFGLSELSIHLHGASWFTLTLLPLYWLTSDLFGKTVARWGILLLSFSVIGFTAPRIGHIPILVPFFAFSALFAGERLLRNGHYRYAVLLGSLLGLGVFTFPTFKSVFVVLVGAALSILCLARYTTISWSSWKTKIRFGRAAWSVIITGGVFLGVVCLIGFGLTGDVVTFQRLTFLLFQYKSNGIFVSDIGHFFRNGVQIVSQVLPTRYLSHPHFLIPRYTGYANALSYLSPLIAVMVLVAFWSGIRIIQRLIMKCPLSQLELTFPEKQPSSSASEKLVSPHGIFIFWRKEYNWMYALWIFGGGCVFAMLSDHTAARRWIYSWFWMYPLAAAGIFWITRKRRQHSAGWLLGLTLLSQMTLVYYPYLYKPWRVQGPSPAVIDTMKAYCDNGYQVYATPMLHHWVRHYEQMVPLNGRGYDILYDPIENAQLPARYAIFDIGDLYRPVKLKNPEATMTFEDPQRDVLITQFRDRWGFYDFKVMESLSE